MATLATTLHQTSRFASDAAGLEKTLRLLQALAQLTACFLDPMNSTPWLVARRQFALGRRYLRFFRFTDAFAAAHTSIPQAGSVVLLLHTAKYNCLGLYLLLESCTILDTMSVYPHPYASYLLFEANKFWFYSLTISLLLEGIRFYALMADGMVAESYGQNRSRTVRKTDSGVPKVELNQEQRERILERRVRRQAIGKRLLVDGCDLLIPGAMVGWLNVGAVGVGMATVVSTVVASGDIWARINGGR